MSTTKKTPAGAATPAREKEDPEMSLTSLHSTRRKLENKIDANFARLRKNNTILGDLVLRVAANPPEDKQKIAKSFEAHRSATSNILDAIHRDCLALVEARAQELEEEQRRREAAAKAAADERATIKAITGEDLSRHELRYRLMEAYRKGGAYLRYLEAMKVLDDEDLAIVGVSSWDELGDEDGDEDA